MASSRDCANENTILKEPLKNSTSNRTLKLLIIQTLQYEKGVMIEETLQLT